MPCFDFYLSILKTGLSLLQKTKISLRHLDGADEDLKLEKKLTRARPGNVLVTWLLIWQAFWQKQLTEGRSDSASQFKGLHSVMVRQERRQKCEPITSRIRKETNECSCSAPSFLCTAPKMTGSLWHGVHSHGDRLSQLIYPNLDNSSWTSLQ